MRTTNARTNQTPRILLLLVAAVALPAVLQPTARADSIAYTVNVTTNGTGTFGTIDLNTGVYTQLGVEANQRGAGVGEVNGELYTGDGFGPGSATFYQVNETNGSFTDAGHGSFLIDGMGSTTNGLFAFSVGSSLQDALQDLYSVDPATGADTLVGLTGINAAGYDGFATSAGASVLYVAVGFPGSGAILYSLDPSTGEATLIGNTGIGVESMLFEDGILWAVASDNSIYTLNPTNGAAAFVATSDSLTSDGIRGGENLAPFETQQSVATPEPSALLLLGTGFMGLLRFPIRRGRIANP